MTSKRDAAIQRAWDDYSLGHLNAEELSEELRRVWSIYPPTEAEEAERDAEIQRQLADDQKLLDLLADEFARQHRYSAMIRGAEMERQHNAKASKPKRGA